MFDLFDDLEMEIDCPECGAEILFKVSDVGNDITCPNCSETFLLEDDGTFLDGVKESNDLLKKLDETLENLGN